MTGIIGGTVDASELGRLVESLCGEGEDTDRFETGAYGLGIVHHGADDPLGHAFWSDGRTAGVIDGAVSNLDELGWGVPEVFERLLRAPERTLDAMEGPFTLACVDASDDRLLLATDKIGCRTPYYTTERGLVFASGLDPFLSLLDDPTLDPQGISDLLLMGNMWSDTTLLSAVRALHPATLLEYRDGQLTERRYWRPDYTPARPTDAYLHELTTTFQRAIDRTANSVAGDVGLWLSGGLDSRATASELARARRAGADFDSLVTYTYDANPGGGANPALASATADALDLPNERVPLTADRFLDALDRGIDATDGMVKWNTFLNLTAAFNIERSDPSILLEGLEGALVGHHLCRHHLSAPSLVRSLYDSEAVATTDEVERLLSVPVDPLGSFRREADRVAEPTTAQAVVDAHFQNYYSRLAHASNAVPRERAGTRVPYADGPLLEHVARLPVSWRMGALPFSDGELIYGVVEPKVRMIRALNADLAAIPYERSSLKPTRPYPLHVLGFYASTALDRLRSKPTYGGTSMIEEWYRSHDRFRETIDGLLVDACERSFFDADAVSDTQARQRDGGGEMHTIGAVTTLERWLQRHYD